MPRPSSPSSRRWTRLVPVVAAFAVAAAFCAALGWWQWERAHDQAVTVDPAPPVPLADVIEPGGSPGAAIGRQVSVTGTWADQPAAVVWGREVDGTPAVFLVRPLRVPASLTGTGEPATIAVLVGWREDTGALTGDALSPGEATINGYLRSGESASPNSSLPHSGIPGTFSTSAIAPSELAQVWDAPLYAAVLVSDRDDGPWEALPPREAESKLDFRSVAYAIEWWIFGAFFVFIGARWVRDNGRIPSMKEDSPHE